MEFGAQDHHHHNNHHNHNPRNHDQIRSATATSAPSFTPQPALTPANSSPSDRRRSLSSNNNNNNTSTMTSSQPQPPIPSQSQTPTNCTTQPQTLDQITPRPPPQKPSAVKYRQCQKNHAASSGGSVYDGCGEFMPSGEEGSLEALKCAACSCHRNFHRKDLDGEGPNAGTLAIYSPGTRRSSSTANPLQITPPPQLHHLNHYPSPYSHHHGNHSHHHHKFPIVQPMNVAYGGLGGGGAESSSEELNATADNSVPPPYSSSASAKKRFRTKFTAEQKERMLEFAERVGWRFQKQDEELVERFCSELGIRRQVLKVWMHNNKSNNLKTANKHQLDHVSILMGNMVGPTSAVPVSASIPIVAPLSAATTDVVMNQHVTDDDEEGLD